MFEQWLLGLVRCWLLSLLWPDERAGNDLRNLPKGHHHPRLWSVSELKVESVVLHVFCNDNHHLLVPW